jgi:GT2 family glycosyltransferase
MVADDGSTDATVAMLQAFAANFELRWTRLGGRGSGAARNTAARAASNELLIFLDDDQIASPNLVGAHLETHERHGVVIVQGAYPLAPGADRRGASLIYEQSRLSYLGADQVPVATAHLWGGNFSVRRETWAALGGFDENLPRNQDLDFGLRAADLGVPFVAAPRAMSHHLHRGSIAGLRRQSLTEGRCFVRISRKRGVSIASLLGGPIDRPLDRLVTRFWLRSARWAAASGRYVSGLLWAADQLRVRPAQVFSSRLLRRFHVLGGIAIEIASVGPP